MSAKKSSKKKVIGIAALVFLAVCVIVLFGLTKHIYDSNFSRAEMQKYSGYLRYDDVDEYNREMIQFTSGKNQLTGYLYGLENDKGLVVIAHGLGGGAESYMAETVYFVDAGWRVFSYDCTGSHRSEGKSTKGLPQSVIDLDAALTYVEQQDWNLPVMLYGHSWGGYAVTAGLNYDHGVNASVSVAGYNSPMELLDAQSKSMMGWVSTFAYPFEWAYQKMLFGKAADLTAVDGINKSGIPVMVIHGAQDEMISYDGASTIGHKDEITNPNVIYKTCDKPGRDGHNTLFQSEAAVKYIVGMNEEYDKIYDQYDGEVPDEVKAEYYSGIDKALTSELDAEFMSEVNDFYEANR